MLIKSICILCVRDEYHHWIKWNRNIYIYMSYMTRTNVKRWCNQRVCWSIWFILIFVVDVWLQCCSVVLLSFAFRALNDIVQSFSCIYLDIRYSLCLFLFHFPHSIFPSFFSFQPFGRTIISNEAHTFIYTQKHIQISEHYSEAFQNSWYTCVTFENKQQTPMRNFLRLYSKRYKKIFLLIRSFAVDVFFLRDSK